MAVIHCKRGKLFVILLCVVIILIDQYTKLWVFSHMKLRELRNMGIIDFYYITNPGICMGYEFSWKYWKILLLVLRFALAYYVVRKTFCTSVQYTYRRTRLCGAGLILGGALGNCIDVIFYGVFLGNAPDYAPFKLFYGQVIDMLCFRRAPLMIPEWVPIFGGPHFIPIFNIADLAIISGAILFIFFDKRKVE